MSSTPPRLTPLTDADVLRYEQQGCLFPVPALSASELARFRGAVDEFEALSDLHNKPILAGRPLQLSGEAHLSFEWAYELVTIPSVLDVVEQIIGPNILVHSSNLFAKRPGASFVSWHQDSHYLDLSSPRLVSVWIALSDSTVANGCMRVQPGSHLSLLPHTEVHERDNMLGTGVTVLSGLDESRAVDVVLRAGEMSLHHAHMLHGSNPNRTNASRVGYAIRYMATDLRQDRAHFEVLLARGEDRYQHFEVVEPKLCSMREGLRRHREFCERLHTLNPDALEPESPL